MIYGATIVFEVIIECNVCNPVEGMIIPCIVKNITKAGIRAQTNEEVSPVVIFIARDHHYMSQILTFLNYWPMLCSGGLYVIEDVNEPNAKDIVDWIGGMRNVDGYTEPYLSIDGIENSHLLVTRSIDTVELIKCKPKNKRNSPPQVIIIKKQ